MLVSSWECVIYANVNVYKLFWPIVIRFSLVTFMEMHRGYSAVCQGSYVPHQHLHTHLKSLEKKLVLSLLIDFVTIIKNTFELTEKWQQDMAYLQYYNIYKKKTDFPDQSFFGKSFLSMRYRPTRGFNNLIEGSAATVLQYSKAFKKERDDYSLKTSYNYPTVQHEKGINFQGPVTPC